MIKLFIDGFPASAQDDELDDIWRDCCGEKHVVKWTRVTDANDQAGTFGFLELDDVLSACALIKVCHDIEINVVPDSKWSSECAAHQGTVNVEGVREKIQDRITSLFVKDKDQHQPSENGHKESFKENVKERYENRLQYDPIPRNASSGLEEEIRSFRYLQAESEILEDMDRRKKLDRLVKRLRSEQNSSDTKKVNTKPAVVVKEPVAPPVKSTPHVPSDPVQKKNMEVKLKIGSMQPKSNKQDSNIDEEMEDIEEGNGTRKRKLVPILYTKEEEDAGKSVAEKIKEAEHRVSTDKLTKIVAKHVEEYLGSAEASLVSFVVKMIQDQKSESHISKEMTEILEDDAPEFTRNLFEDISN